MDCGGQRKSAQLAELLSASHLVLSSLLEVVSSLALVLFHLSGTEQSSEQIRQAGAAPAMLFIAVNVPQLLEFLEILLLGTDFPEAIRSPGLPFGDDCAPGATPAARKHGYKNDGCACSRR